MNKRSILPTLILALFAAASLQAGDLPRLVVQITVDQLRGDLPLRYRDRFGEGGFRYFLDGGTWYAAAHHPHAHTETVVGHATLATGAYPSRHGMVANVWFDRDAGRYVTNIEDKKFPVLPVFGEKHEKGASPGTILTTTLSDELAITTEGGAKIYAVSVKNRGAIPMAGHAGKAFWLSLSSGCFVSTTYYYSEYPQWVKTKCGEQLADKLAGTSWDLLYDRATYLHKHIDNRYPMGSRAEQNMEMLDGPGLGFGRAFPHKFAAKAGGTLYNGITISPRGDELTLDFTKTLIAEERLGKDDVPDYLAVSFSSTDLIAHWFSTVSLESEDNLLRLDRILQDLLSFIDNEVGLENTLLVLSADHGGPEYPESLQKRGIDTGHLSPAKILQAAGKALADRYGPVKGIISQMHMPYIYLDDKVIAKNKLDRSEVERVIAQAVQHLKGVALAVSRTDMESGAGDADEELIRQIRRNYKSSRSGDVYIVQEPQWQIDEPHRPRLLQHGSPWTYDTYVPVAFAGGHVPAALLWRAVSTVDVAPTLAALLRTKYPSGSVGIPLTEILESQAAPDR